MAIIIHFGLECIDLTRLLKWKACSNWNVSFHRWEGTSKFCSNTILHEATTLNNQMKPLHYESNSKILTPIPTTSQSTSQKFQVIQPNFLKLATYRCWQHIWIVNKHSWINGFSSLCKNEFYVNKHPDENWQTFWYWYQWCVGFHWNSSFIIHILLKLHYLYCNLIHRMN